MEIINGKIYLYDKDLFLDLGSYGITPIAKHGNTIIGRCYIYEYNKTTVQLIQDLSKKYYKYRVNGGLRHG